MTATTTRTAQPTSVRRAAARQLAEATDGVLSRDLLAGIGIDDRMIRREVATGRWRLHGTQTVAVHTGPLGRGALLRRAVWEVGVGIAALDGVSALHAAGLTGFDDDLVHVSVKHTAAVRAVRGVRVHKLARRVEDELVASGVPRTRPALAAVRAARWAASDRQAALLMVMPVHQRLCTGRQLLEAAETTRGRTRRRLVPVLARDIALGAQSLGELDFAHLCRSRGLPEPTRQAVRHGARGRVYLDAAWEDIGLVVEIDGAGHQLGMAVTADHLRQNDLALTDHTVLRMDLVGLRLEERRFLDQVVSAHARLTARHLPRSRYSAARFR
jgi:very-short-patch-repair endonuclease